MVGLTFDGAWGHAGERRGGALLGEGWTAAPRASRVWDRLCDGKSVVADGQSPPTLCLA